MESNSTAFLIKIKLRHSLGRPSRSDFVQSKVDKEQAESFLRTSIAKAIAKGTIEEGQKFGYISTFEFKFTGNLETLIFENADVDWLHCIAAHRKKK